MKVKDRGIIFSLWKFDHLAVVVEKTTLTTLIVSLALFVTFVQVYMMYRLYPKRDQLDKWVFQINPLLQTFMVAGFFDVYVSRFASIASAEFKKTFTLKQGFEG